MGRGRGHVPTRTCIACGTKGSRSGLLRLRLDGLGRVRPDERGSGGGRGAYVCRSRRCWEKLSRRGLLNRAFRRDGRLVLDPDTAPGMPGSPATGSS